MSKFKIKLYNTVLYADVFVVVSILWYPLCLLLDNVKHIIYAEWCLSIGLLMLMIRILLENEVLMATVNSIGYSQKKVLEVLESVRDKIIVPANSDPRQIQTQTQTEENL